MRTTDCLTESEKEMRKQLILKAEFNSNKVFFNEKEYEFFATCQSIHSALNCAWALCCGKEKVGSKKAEEYYNLYSLVNSLVLEASSAEIMLMIYKFICEFKYDNLPTIVLGKVVEE